MKMDEMPDREKVIARLEEAMLLSETANECKVTLGYGIVEDALALLKAQEPVEPTRKPEIFDSLYFCGKCSAKVGFQIRKDDSWRFKCKFCPDCGQAVKWE